MMRVLYVASLNTKKNMYDGERIKSTLIFESLKKMCKKVTVINLSKNKIISTFKLLFCSIFKKKQYDKIIVSKDPRGGTIIEKILRFASVDQNKIFYFEIGPFLYSLLKNQKIKPSLFSNNKYVIVETNSMKKELEEFNFKNVLVFPNFKTNPNCSFTKKQYPKKILHLVYLSRIEKEKGIFDLVKAVQEINSDGLKFRLDIYGMFMSSKDEEQLNQLISNDAHIQYKGKLDMSRRESYEVLSTYDIHVFPTHYDEGFPGTLIDFFFVGVPTLSSSFLRFKDILTADDSFVFEQHNFDDLKLKLLSIYSNQSAITEKAINTFNLKDKFTSDSFELFLEKLLNE